MTSLEGLDELYKEVILDHYHHPRHNHDLPASDVSNAGYNPLCGDEMFIQVRLKNGVIEDIGVRGKGCSISQASGSMMAETLVGKPFSRAKEYIAAMRDLLEKKERSADGSVSLGDLEALSGVKNFPVRIKCALLPWTTLEEGIARYEENHGKD